MAGSLIKQILIKNTVSIDQYNALEWWRIRHQ